MYSEVKFRTCKSRLAAWKDSWLKPLMDEMNTEVHMQH